MIDLYRKCRCIRVPIRWAKWKSRLNSLGPIYHLNNDEDTGTAK